MQKTRWHRLKAVTVENHAPDEADLQRLLALEHEGGDPGRRVIHHVFLHLAGPMPIRSMAYHIWIGARQIPEYYDSADGICFKLDSHAELAALYNQAVQFVSDDGDRLHAEALFPDLSQYPTHAAAGRWHKVYRRSI